MNKSELKKVFKNCVVLLECHNEQKHHISDYFRANNINVVKYPMKTADYSFMIMPNSIMGNSGPLFFGQEFLIERKSGDIEKGGGFAELRNNLTKGHEQFKAEFIRMQEVDNVILLIENSNSVTDIKKVSVRSHTDSERFEKTFRGFIANRNLDRNKDIEIAYTTIEKAGEKVASLIFNFLYARYH